MRARGIRRTGVSMVGIMAALGVAALVAGCNSGEDQPLLPHQVVSASGDVAGAVAQFRALLGDPLNGATPGSQAAGRREINWDGVPASFTGNDAFPGDFFNTRSPRGAVFTAPAFRVSDRNLAEVDPSYAGQFSFFSPQKTFAVSGSAVMETEFQVPGATTPAVVRGFGVVFVDVDRQGSAYSRVLRAEREPGPLRRARAVRGQPTVLPRRRLPGHRGDPRPHRLRQRCPRCRGQGRERRRTGGPRRDGRLSLLRAPGPVAGSLDDRRRATGGGQAPARRSFASPVVLRQ